jgi:hypothetical protein
MNKKEKTTKTQRHKDLKIFFVSLCLCGFLLLVNVQASLQEHSGSISGRVIGDDGRPLASANVYLRGSNVTIGESRSVAVDDDGRFQISDLSSGNYRIRATAPGYVDQNYIDPDKGMRRYYRTGDNVTLTMIKGGVITGVVTGPNGEPVVAVSVWAVRVRDTEGHTLGKSSREFEQVTDDRGIYRLFGLPPGSYLICAGKGELVSSSRIFEDDAPTYYPSTSHSSAREVAVRSGEEVGGIDIRYRGDQGHTISGRVLGSAGSKSNSDTIDVTLSHIPGGVVEATAELDLDEDDRSFKLQGVPDGEYELLAECRARSENGAASPARRIVIKGRDLTGVDLQLVPLGSIAGRVLFEARKPDQKIDCAGKRSGSLEETVILGRRDERDKGKDRSISRSLPVDDTPDKRGNFALRSLDAGSYHLDLKLQSENWYIRSVTLNKIAAGNGIALRAGDRLTGLVVTIGEDGGGIRGRVVPAAEGEQLPAGLRAHLVPAEKEQAENALRYAEVEIRNGEFEFVNIAPGKYWILARFGGETDRPVAWDSEGRAMLRREAMAVNNVIDLGPCSRVRDYFLHFRR